MAERPLLSVIVPTVGRPSLERTVNSLLRQGEWLSWEAILVGDAHAGTWAHQLDTAADLAARYPEHLRYVEHDGGAHMVGHPQRNFGATIARGDYLSWLGDDDIYVRWAFFTLAHTLRPLEQDDAPQVSLFRWISSPRSAKQVLWHTAGFLGDGPGHIDAENIVCPNVPEKLGRWTDRYEGDYDFIRQTIENFGGLDRVRWQPEVLAQAQPSEAEDWTNPVREVAPVVAGEAALTVLVPQVITPEAPP